MERTCREVAATAGTVLLVDASYIPTNEPKAEGPPDYSRGHLKSSPAPAQCDRSRFPSHQSIMFNEIV